MPKPRELPPHLGDAFSVHAATDAGVSAERLRRGDLDRPFRGVRSRTPEEAYTPDEDVFERQAAERRARAESYAPRLRENQFFSHETAAALRRAPLPLIVNSFGPIDGAKLPVHVSTMGDGALVRMDGVRAHRADARTTTVERHEGLPVSTPATTWASLGALSVSDLVVLGDFLCRCWRAGFGRKHVGRRPLSTVEELRLTIASGRRVGNRRLREAVELIRTDSWSPRESQVRCILIAAGLPEPELNIDVYDGDGVFLGCVDMAYPAKRVAIEYQGTMHSTRYAKDVERIAALRAAGWTVIEVTAALFKRPTDLIRRVASALAN